MTDDRDAAAPTSPPATPPARIDRPGAAPAAWDGSDFQARAGWPWALFLFPLPLFFAAVAGLPVGDLGALLVNGTLFAWFMIAATTMKRGLAAAAAYDAAAVATPPPPLKTIAAGMVAAGVFAASALASAGGVVMGLLLGVGAFVGCAVSYGLDPRRAKEVAPGEGVSTARYLEEMSAARARIAAIEAARAGVRNPELNRRLDGIVAAAREVMADLEKSPGDLRRARKFIHVYLDGAQKVTEAYVRTHDRTDLGALEGNFARLLDEIESAFHEQRKRLLEDDIVDLDIQMEVLATRLKHEGVV